MVDRRVRARWWPDQDLPQLERELDRCEPELDVRHLESRGVRMSVSPAFSHASDRACGGSIPLVTTTHASSSWKSESSTSRCRSRGSVRR